MQAFLADSGLPPTEAGRVAPQWPGAAAPKALRARVSPERDVLDAGVGELDVAEQPPGYIVRRCRGQGAALVQGRVGGAGPGRPGAARWERCSTGGQRRGTPGGGTMQACNVWPGPCRAVGRHMVRLGIGGRHVWPSCTRELLRTGCARGCVAAAGPLRSRWVAGKTPVGARRVLSRAATPTVPRRDAPRCRRGMGVVETPGARRSPAAPSS